VTSPGRHKAGGREGDDTDPGTEIKDLTPEQIVDAEMAMLLDLGRAEELAERIAAQSRGERDTVADRMSSPDP
jgi:hypothetical protein